VQIYTAHFQKISNALSTSRQYFAKKCVFSWCRNMFRLSARLWKMSDSEFRGLEQQNTYGRKGLSLSVCLSLSTRQTWNWHGATYLGQPADPFVAAYQTTVQNLAEQRRQKTAAVPINQTIQNYVSIQWTCVTPTTELSQNMYYSCRAINFSIVLTHAINYFNRALIAEVNLYTGFCQLKSLLYYLKHKPWTCCINHCELLLVCD